MCDLNRTVKITVTSHIGNTEAQCYGMIQSTSVITFDLNRAVLDRSIILELFKEAKGLM